MHNGAPWPKEKFNGFVLVWEFLNGIIAIPFPGIYGPEGPTEQLIISPRKRKRNSGPFQPQLSMT
jgi:hypothetical protein